MLKILSVKFCFFKSITNFCYLIEAAATKGEEEKQELEQSKKVSLLVAEGHTSYEYSDLLDRISKLLKDKNPHSVQGS